MNEAETLSNLLDWITETETKSVETIRKLLSYTADNYTPEKDTVIDKYDLIGEKRFNIFETISDQYHKEKFHSDILYSILSPETPEIGTICNKEILEEFVKMVDSAFDFKVDDTVKVSKEESNKVLNGDYEKQGYIDLLITNSQNKAIIIENKINDAQDMENQLVRYMDYVKNQKFGKSMTDKEFKNNVRVVYLTLEPGKIPNIDEYGNSFAEYKELLSDAKSGKDGKILKYRSAVDSDEKKNDLHTFLEKSIEHLEKITEDEAALLKKIYIKQYKTLLGHLGGNAAMLEYQKDLLKEIYSSPEKLKAAKDLVEAFNTKDAIVAKLILDGLKPLVEPMGFSFETNRGWQMYCIWNNNKTEYLYVGGNRSNFEIGFGTNSTFEQSSQEKYKKILETVFSSNAYSDECWILFHIEPFADKNNMKEFLEYCTSFIPQVKEEFLAL
ncbi:MAG: PD-(D/E)XK nuclease family protein [Spirochaetaceae bacterium]|nr:PD-(D/E)XK nuclease family protein [Spirochaetaceae bacterium]